MLAPVNNALLNIALSLSSNLASEKQYQYLIDGIDEVFPCDASALFLLNEDQQLVPVAVKGLSHNLVGQSFQPKEHPRLHAIMESKSPVRFDADSPFPDPFDGLLLTDTGHIDVHDCLGCSLHLDNQLVGVLTLDALDVDAFDNINQVTLETFAALAAATLRNIAQLETLKKQNKQQKDITETLIEQVRDQKGHIIGDSPQMHALRNNIATVAQSDFAVLISGETGTGKELVAHAIHAASSRSKKPMIYVNCAALPESLAESELFGHVKGAFTGATSHRAGKFELADGGTLFLDEIGELPLVLQAKLLRVIQQGELQRVGSDKFLVVNTRIIAATNRDLPNEIVKGNFRADLFHRLNVFPIFVPPLRVRDGDIALLSEYLLDKIRNQFNQPELKIHARAMTALEQYEWLGNVRELEHVITRAALRTIQDNATNIVVNYFDAHILREDVKNTSSLFPVSPQPMRVLIEQYQKQLIEHALNKTSGIWSQAALFLKTDRGNLHKLGKKLGIKS